MRLRVFNGVDDDVRVIVLDNGSTDGSQDYLAAEFPQVELVANEPNNYAAANNRGVDMAKGSYAMLLNTDTELAPGCRIKAGERARSREELSDANGY